MTQCTGGVALMAEDERGAATMVLTDGIEVEVTMVMDYLEAWRRTRGDAGGWAGQGKYDFLIPPVNRVSYLTRSWDFQGYDSNIVPHW